MTDYPADGWQETMHSGTWGTDADQDNSLSTIGGYSTEFKNTTPGSNPELRTDLIAVEPGAPYLLYTKIRADSTTAANHMIAKGYWFQRDGTSAASTASTTIIDAAVNAANTWEEYSEVVEAPSNAAFIRMSASKTNTAFTGHYDALEPRRLPKMFDVLLTSSQTLTSSPDRIDFDKENYLSGYMYGYDLGGWYDTAAYQAVCPIDGVYSFEVFGRAYGLSAGDIVYAAIKISGSTMSQTSYIVVPTGYTDQYFHTTANNLFLPAGTVAYVWFYYSGAAPTMDNAYTRFSGILHKF